MAARRYPLAGTVHRKAWDAAHARWCGPQCPNGPGCTQWHGDMQEIEAIVAAVRLHDARRAFKEATDAVALAKRTEQGIMERQRS